MKRILFLIGALACWGTPAANPVEDGLEPGLLFHSDWSTARGTGDAAVRDTDKALPWNINANQNGKRVDTGLQMAVEANTLFPNQSFANMLRANQYGKSSKVKKTDLPIPAIGEHRYYRFYLYSDVGINERSYGFAGNHPIELQPGNDEQELWRIGWGHSAGSTQMNEWSMGIGRGAAWPDHLWFPPAMLERTVYRIEIHMQRTADLTYSLDMRVYDGGNPGTLLYDNDDFVNRDGSKTLVDDRSHPYVDTDEWRGFDMGGNGELGDGGVIVNGIFYYGAVCIRSDTWCGPYAGGI